MPVRIYTLSDPVTGYVRYVGQTSHSLRKREREHWCSRRRPKHRVSRWIAKLARDERRPVMELLEEVADSDADAAEEYWIAQCRSFGFNLTNLRPGGMSARGYKVSTERAAQIAEVARRPDVVAAKSAAAKVQHAAANAPRVREIEAALRAGAKTREIPYASALVAKVRARMMRDGWTPPCRKAERAAGCKRHADAIRERISSKLSAGMRVMDIVASGHSKATVLSVKRGMEAIGWVHPAEVRYAEMMEACKQLVSGRMPHSAVMACGYSNRMVMEARRQVRHGSAS